MRVLVTGGLGFLGHAVTHRLLAADHTPIVLSRRPEASSPIPGAQTVVADLRDSTALKAAVDAAQPDGICHLAALTRVRDSFERPLEYFDVNLGGSAALLHAVEGKRLPLVFASTGAVYGPCQGRITEAQPTLPTTPYGASKLAAEQLLRYHAQAGAIGTMILRCFNMSGAVDGVGDRDATRIIPKALAVAAGTASHIDINGDGSVIREFSHVADVANAVVMALGATRVGAAETFNVGSGVQSTMMEIVRTVKRVTGRTVPVEFHPPRQEPAVLMADSGRLRAKLGWEPVYGALEGMVADAWGAAAPA